MTSIAEELAELDRQSAEARRRLDAADERRKELQRQVAEEYARKVAATLTREMVDLLAPTHGRTTCDDTKLANGFNSGRELPRCTRCALLETVASKSWPPGVRLMTDVVIA